MLVVRWVRPVSWCEGRRSLSRLAMPIRFTNGYASDAQHSGADTIGKARPLATSLGDAGVVAVPLVWSSSRCEGRRSLSRWGLLHAAHPASFSVQATACARFLFAQGARSPPKKEKNQLIGFLATRLPSKKKKRKNFSGQPYAPGRSTVRLSGLRLATFGFGEGFIDPRRADEWDHARRKKRVIRIIQ